MLDCPFVPRFIALDQLAYGAWTSASIHEIAQVAGAMRHSSLASRCFGIITKLLRVMIPTLLVMALGVAARTLREQATHPWEGADDLVRAGLHSDGRHQ